MTDDATDGPTPGDDRPPGGCTGKGFVPGKSGNPGGRPKGRSITAELNRLLDEGLPDWPGVDLRAKLAETAVREALAGKGPALKEVWERSDGKAAAPAADDPGAAATLRDAAAELREILARRGG